MDLQGLFILFVFGVIILLYLKKIKEIIVPAKKSTGEKAVVLLTVGIILLMLYFMGENWLHYLVGFLAIILLSISLMGRGITAKGFLSIKGLIFGHWSKLSRVRVTREEDIKILFTGRATVYSKHTYAIEDYEEILTILEDNLSEDVLNIEE